MKKFKQSVCQGRQKLAWEQPYPVTNQVGRYSVKGGANLPNSITEDMRGLSLCPSYSVKQQRTIRRIAIRKVKYGHGNLKLTLLRSSRNIPKGKQVIIKRAFNMEALL